VVCPVPQGAEHGRESANPALNETARVSTTVSPPSRHMFALQQYEF